MLDKEKVLSNLKYADIVVDKAKGFSVEADRVRKMYWTLREIRSTAVPALPWEYVEKMESLFTVGRKESCCSHYGK